VPLVPPLGYGPKRGVPIPPRRVLGRRSYHLPRKLVILLFTMTYLGKILSGLIDLLSIITVMIQKGT